ncbi:MAG: hypothetical protein IPP42_00005 [Saprospiraceae bacterium]|nr:hypothetical protein [Saprospiraceae bacterium]
MEKLRKNACDYNLIIGLQGPYSDRSSGWPCCLTILAIQAWTPAGTGDVLTRRITRTGGTGCDGQSAALIGTFIHGFAGDPGLQGFQ